MPVKNPPKKQPNTSRQAKATADELRTKPVITPTAISNEGLPDGWRWVKLGDISEKVDSVKRTVQNPKTEFFYLDIGGIDNARNIILDHKVYTWKDAPSRAQQIVRKNDILFSTVRTYMKNIAIIDREIYSDQIASSGFCVIRAKRGEVDPRYIFYLTLSNSFLQPLNELQTGSSYPAVRDKDVFSQLVPLAPFKDQHAIVSKIEELLSELDKGKQQLETAQQQLKIYRQAVLKWAFEGKLTNKNVKEGELPEGWKWVKNKDILKYVTSGSRDWKQFYSTRGSRFIRTQDINSNKLDIDNAAFVTLPEKVEGKRSLIEDGDILMTITGANVGKIAVVDFPIKDAYVSQSVTLLKYNDKRITKYLWYYFQAQGFGKSFIDKLVYGVGRPVLSLENMREVDVLLCPLEDQQQIIDELESKLTVCDKIEETISISLQQTETLRQSILKKAFEGKFI